MEVGWHRDIPQVEILALLVVVQGQSKQPNSNPPALLEFTVVCKHETNISQQ